MDLLEDKFRRQLGKTFCLTFSRPDIKLNILPLAVPCVAQTFSKGLKKCIGIWNADDEYADGR
jgi:hypothetical protein